MSTRSIFEEDIVVMWWSTAKESRVGPRGRDVGSIWKPY
jgi:hypothetical protein